MTYTVKKILSKDTHYFLLNVHYARRLPSISFAFGLFKEEELIGVVTYGSPASPSLCKGVAGEINRPLVIELNRLCLKYNGKNEASFLVANSIKMLPRPKIIVSYSDSAQNHAGIVYQASNFLFTGTSKPRTDMFAGEGKHSRHAKDPSIRQFRSAKHRYIYIHGTKNDKKHLLSQLKYSILEYPKL
jgi:hypothetical protein